MSVFDGSLLLKPSEWCAVTKVSMWEESIWKFTALQFARVGSHRSKAGKAGVAIYAQHMKDRIRRLGEYRQPGWAGSILVSSVHTRQAVFKDWYLNILPYREQPSPSPVSLTPCCIPCRWRDDAIYMCVYLLPACVFWALLRTLLVYGWVLMEKLRIVCPADPPSRHSPLCKLQSIILIPPHHHTTRERGDSLSWNLAHSTGWGNQLRPDWQPPFLIPFSCSLLRVLFLLLCRFALAMPPSSSA